MEKRLYTIEDACRILGKSRATVYNWTNSGKLEFEDHPEGRMVYLQSNLESNQESSLSDESNLESSENLDSNDQIYSKSKLEKDEVSLKLLDQLESMQEKLLFYAEQSGKTKLLTDNNKFYQDEYFRLKYELEYLQKSYKEKENEYLKQIADLKTENERYKKSIFSRFFSK